MPGIPGRIAGATGGMDLLKSIPNLVLGGILGSQAEKTARANAEANARIETAKAQAAGYASNTTAKMVGAAMIVGGLVLSVFLIKKVL